MGGKIKHTLLLGRKVKFLDDEAWTGIPHGVYIKNEIGIIVSVYVDEDANYKPLYTVELSGGILVEAAAKHFEMLSAEQEPKL